MKSSNKGSYESMSQRQQLFPVSEEDDRFPTGRRPTSQTSLNSSPSYTTTEDLSAFALPGLAEEATPQEQNNNIPAKTESRPRSSSFKALFGFKRSKTKSESKSTQQAPKTKESPLAQPLPVRPRSQSDAANVHNSSMRRRHISSSGTQPAAPVETNGINNNGTGDFRSRSTSWGSKPSDILRRHSYNKGDGTPNAVNGKSQGTIMSQLISKNSAMPNPRKLSHVDKLNGNGETQFTGKAFIWQRAQSIDENAKQWHTTVSECHGDDMEIADLEVNDAMLYHKFMKAHKCYDLIPTSAKLIIFDTQLSVKKAFFALVYNCCRAAPLWDSERQDFVGMLTISDFIQMLNKCYKSPNVAMNELEEHRISTWREFLSTQNRPFISIDPDACLFQAVSKLLKYRVHRLPVVDPITGNALYVLTHKRVLKFLCLFMRDIPKPAFMKQTISELKIGTYDDIASVTYRTKLIDALALFVKNRVSALPILDEQRRVVNIYAKFDVINLAADKAYNNLEIPISDALSHKNNRDNQLIHTCHRTDSLNQVVEIIVKAEVHRLIIVTEQNKLDGIISLSDILGFLVSNESFPSPTIEQLNTKKCADPMEEEKMDVYLGDPVKAV